jgi:hypothetical protein
MENHLLSDITLHNVLGFENSLKIVLEFWKIVSEFCK